MNTKFRNSSQHFAILRELRAVASKYEFVNLAGSLRGARKQTTWHRLLDGAKDDGVGGWTPSIDPPLPGQFG